MQKSFALFTNQGSKQYTLCKVKLMCMDNILWIMLCATHVPFSHSHSRVYFLFLCSAYALIMLHWVALHICVIVHCQQRSYFLRDFHYQPILAHQQQQWQVFDTVGKYFVPCYAIFRFLCWNVEADETAEVKGVFTGPRCLWGPVYGSQCTYFPTRTLLRLCWCDSGWWWYQLNTSWWCQ